MAQFDVYLNPNPETKSAFPYLLDIQNNLLEGLSTRVVVPLRVVKQRSKLISHLNPQFDINGKNVIMSTAEIAGIPQRAIGKHVCSLSNKRYEIVNALDFLVTGI